MGQLDGVYRRRLDQIGNSRLPQGQLQDSRTPVYFLGKEVGECELGIVPVFDPAKFWSKNAIQFRHPSTFAKK